MEMWRPRNKGCHGERQRLTKLSVLLATTPHYHSLCPLLFIVMKSLNAPIRRGLWTLIVQIIVLVGWNTQDMFRAGFFSPDFWTSIDFWATLLLAANAPPPATSPCHRGSPKNRKPDVALPKPSTPAGFFLPATGVIRYKAKGRSPMGWAHHVSSLS